VHIPDGFFEGHTSAGAGVAAAAGTAIVLRKAADDLAAQPQLARVAAATAAVVFAGQMANFGVADGTSGHLIGGVLAAVLVGPWLASLSVTLVLVVQAVVFADGGLSALGLNVINLSFVAAIGGWFLYRGLQRWVGDTPKATTVAAGLAAAASVVLASAAFTVEHALGATTEVATLDVLAAMVGVHLLIGVGEGIITGAVVATVLATQPGLLYGRGGASVQGGAWVGATS
jgi:cobalt/nickel transport system permease protein